MARDTNLQTYFTDVADAIRERSGTNEQLSPYIFANKIREIDTGIPLDTEHGGIINIIVPDGYVIEKGDFLFWSNEIQNFIPERIDYDRDIVDAIALESGFPGLTIKILARKLV